jgi:hypothetical protein
MYQAIPRGTIPPGNHPRLDAHDFPGLMPGSLYLHPLDYQGRTELPPDKTGKK